MFRSRRTIFLPVIFYCLFLTNQLVIAEDAENKDNPLLEKFNVTAIKHDRAQVPAEEILELIKNLGIPPSNGTVMQAPGAEGTEPPLPELAFTNQNVVDLINQLGFTSHPAKKKFSLVDEDVSWVTALSKCSRKKMRLASVKSAEDQLGIVQELFRRRGDPRMSFWVGGTELFEEGSWMWMGDLCSCEKFDSTPNAYIPWKKDEPEAKKSCIRLMYDGWMTSPCDHKHWYICEYLENA